MSIYAVYLQNWHLGQCFGITVRFLLISAGVSICCIVFFGELLPGCG